MANTCEWNISQDFKINPILQDPMKHCNVLHYLALSCTILHYLALSCIILHYLACSCMILHYLTLSCIIFSDARKSFLIKFLVHIALAFRYCLICIWLISRMFFYSNLSDFQLASIGWESGLPSDAVSRNNSKLTTSAEVPPSHQSTAWSFSFYYTAGYVVSFVVARILDFVLLLISMRRHHICGVVISRATPLRQ